MDLDSPSSIDWNQELSADSRQRREAFARFGLAMYQAQCVEKQLGILMATSLNPDFLRSSPDERDRFFDLELAKTLGRLLEAIGKKVSLSPEFESRLRRACRLETGSRITTSGTVLGPYSDLRDERR